MPLKFEIPEETDVRPKIVVVGLGGGGGNAVDTMIRQGLAGVGFVAGNTDGQALRRSLAETKVLLGSSCSKGLGAGGDPDKGAQAAKEDIHLIREHLEGADMCFVTAGMGGGTGTGSAPVVAQIARELGILTVGVVTRPFRFEGKKRERRALEGTALLREAVDSIITIPNEKLMEIAGAEMGIEEAFQRADDVLLQAVRGISDLVVNEGVVNVDFADVRSVMTEAGTALLGIGVGSGCGDSGFQRRGIPRGMATRAPATAQSGHESGSESGFGT